MRQQATSDQIKDKVLLAVNSYPTQGIELKLLGTVVKEFLHDFFLDAARSDIEAVVESMHLPTRTRDRVKYYYTEENIHKAIRA